MVPALIGIILLFQSLVLTSTAIVRERERGTIEQLIVTPIRSGELIVGKIVPYVVIAFINMIEVLLIGAILFRCPMNGSVLLLLALAALFMITTLGIGLLISTIARTQQEAMITAIFYILPNIFLSGFFFPIAAMPPVLQLDQLSLPAALLPDHRARHRPQGRRPGCALAGGHRADDLRAGRRRGRLTPLPQEPRLTKPSDLRLDASLCGSDPGVIEPRQARLAQVLAHDPADGRIRAVEPALEGRAADRWRGDDDHAPAVAQCLAQGIDVGTAPTGSCGDVGGHRIDHADRASSEDGISDEGRLADGRDRGTLDERGVVGPG